MIPTYLTEQHIENLNIEAFKSITKVLFEFVVEGEAQTEDTIAWVCNAVMGSGKTTALKVLLKHMINSNKRTPLLLVFNELSLMQEIYTEIITYSEEKELSRVIQYVDSDNVGFVIDSLSEYQFICITQQRFRDLTLKYGEWSKYESYSRNKDIPWKRLIIVDEMPELFDTAVFDISSNNNSVDWFDILTESSAITASEKQFARTMIMMLLSLEMLESEGNRTTNLPLIKGITGAESKERFKSIILKIKPNSADYEASRQYKWFQRLLNEAGIGAIDRQRNGVSILCSSMIHYHFMGNILILDGTSHWTREIYPQVYTMKDVPNNHDYLNRLVIHLRNINTTKSARQSVKADVHSKVASDIIAMRERLNMSIFPLCNKGDIKIYIQKKAITAEQTEFYLENEGDSETSPINLLNTKGKNAFKDYRGLALLNLPIKHPNYYKLICIGLYGANIDLTMNDRLVKNNEDESNDGWFKHVFVEVIYKQVFKAELFQIIHRCELRKMNKNTQINIVIYTHMLEWMKELLKISLDLTDANFKLGLVDDKYNIREKSERYSQLILKYCTERSNNFENPTFTAGAITPKGDIKNWFKNNYTSDFNKQVIHEIFNSNGVEIVEEIKNEKIWKSFKLTESEWDTRFGSKL